MAEESTRNRDSRRILAQLHAELSAVPGTVIELGQLEQTIRDYEDRLRDLHGEAQYRYEQYRRAKDAQDYERSARATELQLMVSGDTHSSDVEPR